MRTGTEEIRILGVRRVSAQRVADSKRNIPHFSYVEEVDLTELERLRKYLNSQLPKGAPVVHVPAVPRDGAGASDRAIPEGRTRVTTPSATCSFVTTACTSASRLRPATA